MYNLYGVSIIECLAVALTTEYGGEWLRPDGGSIGCMPRTPVGLVNHPALNFTWQLTVANGSLNWLLVLPDFVCELGKGAKKQAGTYGCSDRQCEISLN